MKYFYYNITSDLVSSGMMFLIYFTTFAIFALLIAINFRFRNNRSQSLAKVIKRPFLYRIPNHIEHANKYIDFLEYESYKKLIYRVEEIEELKRNMGRRGNVLFQTRIGQNLRAGNRDRSLPSRNDNNPFFQARYGSSVDPNLWRGFNARTAGAQNMGGLAARNRNPYSSVPGQAAASNSDITSMRGGPDGDNNARSGSRFENLKRKKKDG